MPGWLFTTPCCAFRSGRLRPILLFKYKEDVWMFSYFLLFWYCPFNLFINQCFCWRIYPLFFFNVRRYWSFYWRINLRFFFFLYITAAFIEEFTLVFSILSIPCNTLKELFLFNFELQAFLLFNISTVSLLPDLFRIAAVLPDCSSPTLQQHQGSLLAASAPSAVIWLALLHQREATKKLTPCCCWREAVW